MAQDNLFWAFLIAKLIQLVSRYTEALFMISFIYIKLMTTIMFSFDVGQFIYFSS